eukprot:768174-Hanusia_phi.AAC.3
MEEMKSREELFIQELKSKEQENSRLREELNSESGSLRGILQRGLSIREHYSPEDIDVLYQTIEEFSWWRSISDDSLIELQMRLDSVSSEHQMETEHLRAQILDLEGQLARLSETLNDEQLKFLKLETALFENSFHCDGPNKTSYNTTIVSDLEDRVSHLKFGMSSVEKDLIHNNIQTDSLSLRQGIAIQDLEFEIEKLKRMETLNEIPSNKHLTITDRVWIEEKRAHENTKWKLVQAEKSLALSSKKISELESAIEDLSEAFLEWKVSSNAVPTSDAMQQKILSLEAERMRLLQLHNDDVLKLERLDTQYKQLQSNYTAKERELKESVDYLSAAIPELGSLKANNRIQKLTIQELSQLVDAKNQEISRLQIQVHEAKSQQEKTEFKPINSVDWSKIQMFSDKNAESEMIIKTLEEKLTALMIENKQLTSVAFEKELIQEQNQRDLEIRLQSSIESQSLLKEELERLEKEHQSSLKSLYLLSNSLQSTRAKFFNILSPLDFEIVETTDFEKLSQVVQREASELVLACLESERESKCLRGVNEKLEKSNSTSNQKLTKANRRISALKKEVEDLHQEFLSIIQKKKTAQNEAYQATKKKLEDTILGKSEAEEEVSNLRSELNSVIVDNQELKKRVRSLEGELLMKSKSHLEQLAADRENHQDVLLQKQDQHERLSVAFDSLNEICDRALDIQQKTRMFAIKKAQRFALHQYFIFWFHFTRRLAHIKHVKEKMSFFYSVHYKAGFFKLWKSHSKFLSYSRRLIDKVNKIQLSCRKSFAFKMFWVITQEEQARSPPT